MAGVFALITGGGTGGHVYPALALAEELVTRGHGHHAIRFVGASRGLEARAVPAAGFAIDLLPGRGLRRRLAPGNLVALLGALVAFVRAWRILGRHRPAVVVGVGGYASLPCVVAARLRRIPVVVHEQNAAPGLANRIAVRLGARAAVSLPGTPLRGAVVVGNPVRRSIAQVQRRPDPRRPLVVAFGGSLGSRTINEAILGLVQQWSDGLALRLHHICGRRDEAWCRQVAARLPRSSRGCEYTLSAYEEDMGRWYAQASLVVARAGAVTVAELAAAGVPALLVPLPRAPGDHQRRNASVLAERGAARVLPDAECSPERLRAELTELLSDPEALDRMAEAARSLAVPDAAARLADLVEEVAASRVPDEVTR